MTDGMRNMLQNMLMKIEWFKIIKAAIGNLNNIICLHLCIMEGLTNETAHILYIKSNKLYIC